MPITGSPIRRETLLFTFWNSSFQTDLCTSSKNIMWWRFPLFPLPSLWRESQIPCGASSQPLLGLCLGGLTTALAPENIWGSRAYVGTLGWLPLSVAPSSPGTCHPGGESQGAWLPHTVRFPEEVGWIPDPRGNGSASFFCSRASFTDVSLSNMALK